MRGLAVFLVVMMVTPAMATAEYGQAEQYPEPIANHIFMTWAALTLEVGDWSKENPEIVNLVDVGKSELGKTLWVVQLSDWSMETKADGSAKEIIYIDGGHHGNEYLGTALAWLSAKWYINGWNDGNEEAVRVLQNSEIHVLIMLNPDGNDIDTRWNINQVDLNRNYDHYWNTCPTTQPGSSAFSESETSANSNYMNTEVPDADLYVTMHTGVWIMLYPWGKWPEQPSDWELFHFIRDDVHANISDIPIQNANQGLYPNCGTSRDYGYGVMGFPTFTFETDDEQFVPGTFEDVNDRLSEEMDVMRYLIDNVWYWRARLSLNSFIVENGNIAIDVDNLGRASTSNATVRYIADGDVQWTSETFGVNATNSTQIILDASNLTMSDTGYFELYYQKRVIDASIWVNETIPTEIIEVSSPEKSGFLPFASPMLAILAIGLAGFRKNEDLS